MQITSAGVEVSGTTYTWQQSLWFFAVGAVWAVAAAMPPALWTIYYNYTHYEDPIDPTLMKGLVISTITPALAGYWQKHKALLKMPPYFIIPPEFHPGVKQVETTVQKITPPLAPGDPKVIETVKESHAEAMPVPIQGTGDGKGTGTGDGKP